MTWYRDVLASAKVSQLTIAQHISLQQAASNYVRPNGDVSCNVMTVHASDMIKLLNHIEELKSERNKLHDRLIKIRRLTE